MRVKIMTLEFSYRLRDFDTTVLDRFLVDKKLSKLEQHFFMLDQKPYLTVILEYENGQEVHVGTASSVTTQAGSFNPRTQLTEEEWPLFESLREWRRERSKQEGLPHYSILKNQTLIDLIKQRPANVSQLCQIRGIGQGKAAKYGEDL
ncbi:HRDC domain-containing protein, partial [Deltaproteobacteria bacterium TL4]